MRFLDVHSHVRLSLTALAVSLLILGATAEVTARPLKADFNGDGFADLAVGVADSTVVGRRSAGSVNVIYGSATGLTANGNQIWRQNSPGTKGEVGREHGYGFALAVGDLNNDGFSDLAIGVLGQDRFAGAVHVLYGSAAGLTARGDQLWNQDSPGLRGRAERNDDFGSALAIGDFDNDGFDDLAVGVTGQTIASRRVAGAVHVLYGTAGGLTAARDQVWHQNSPGIRDRAETLDVFGTRLAVGDFNNDGSDDLAIGAWEDLNGRIDAGAVHVIYGSDGGLTAAGNQFWNEDTRGIKGRVGPSNFFGDVLAVGDFDGDGFDDLAIGVGGENMGRRVNVGAVNVLYGSPRGLRAKRNQRWHQDSPGIKDKAEEPDLFGRELAAGDFDNDGFDDLAVGVPRESLRGKNQPGAVNVLYGSNQGLAAAGNQFWHQDRPGILDRAERFDSFGLSMTTGDFDNDSFDDLVVGLPFEDLGDLENAGAVNVIYGSAQALTAAGNQFLHRDTPGIKGTGKRFEFFGGTLR